MNTTCCRKFGVLDALIFVAATAVALGLTMSDWGVFAVLFRMFGPGGDPDGWMPGTKRYCARRAIGVLAAYLLCWTIAYLALRLRGPRPPARRLWRQPGMTAAVAAAAVSALSLAVVGVFLCAAEVAFPNRTFGSGLPTAPAEAGCAVAASWAVQMLSGRWRPESGWLDRTGRALGVLWIGTVPLSWFPWPEW